MGDRIVAATAGAAAVAGTAAGLAIAAPVAVVDQNTRENYTNQVGALGATVPRGHARANAVSNDCNTGKTAARNACGR